MKKRLLAIVAFLVALVMSFALVACGDKTNNGKGNGTDNDPPTLTSAKLKTALGKIENAKTLELELYGYADSKNEDKAEFEANVVVSGDKAKYTDPETELSYVIDLKTGYGYSEDEDGKYYVSQMLPAGMFDYVDDVLAANFGEAGEVDYTELVKQFSYDETYGGFVAKVDAKDNLNAVLKFVQDAYADDLTLNEVIDSLLQKATNEETVTLEALLDLMCSEEGYGLVKNMTLAQLLGESADEVFNELFAAFDEAGITLTAADKAAIKNRKIGAIAAGAMAVVNEVMEDGLEVIDPGVVMNALLFANYTEEQIDAVGTMLAAYSEMLIDFLKDAKVRTYIDDAPIEIKAIVAGKVQLVELSSTFSVKFDDNGDITEFKFDGYAEHNYTGKDYADVDMLKDNNYAVSLTVGIAAKDTATSFDITFAEDAETPVMVMAYVGAYNEANTIIYYETCGKDVVVSNVQAMRVDVNTGSVAPIENSGVVYDTDKNNFVIPAEVAAAAVEDSDGEVGTLIVTFTLTVDGEPTSGYVSCVVMPDASVDTLVGLVMGMFEGM